MSVLLHQIAKAERRRGSRNLGEARSFARDKMPADLNSQAELEDRKSFLQDSIGDPEQAEVAFERIIHGNELQDSNYLIRGARAAMAVGRVVIREQSGRRIGYGTGFLIAPNVFITNHHVLPNEGVATRSEVNMEFERDIEGQPIKEHVFSLEPDKLFFSMEKLDFTVVAVREESEPSGRLLSKYGWLPLVGSSGKVSEGEWLTIIQHPNGERKQLCVRENRLLKRDTDVLWYSTDTLGGSSGSPTFNNDWYVVAVHHSGVPERKNDKIQTVDGRDWDQLVDGEEKIKWQANEGIRVSRIVQTLKERLPAHEMLGAVFAATPSNARISDIPASLDGSRHFTQISQHLPKAEVTTKTEVAIMESKFITVKLEVRSNGTVRVVDSTDKPAFESTVSFEERRARRPREEEDASFDIPFETDYGNRKGFEEDFIGVGAMRVNLPRLSPALEKVSVKLLTPKGKNKNILHYHNFSVVMHEERRFAIYSAANVRGDLRYQMSRPADVWRTDTRIDLKAQISNFYYKKNQFDRGHLTRREDLEFGTTAMDALKSAADTCHWSNCVPQHSKFNQNKELWQGIERHLLEGAIVTNNFKAQVFTGPVLEEDDPSWEEFPDIQYPVKFWKVVAAVNSKGDLFATAYILDQSEVIEQFGIEKAGEIPFGAYKTFQVEIEEVERLTQLEFTAGPVGSEKSLAKFDPLIVSPHRRRSRGRRFEEATTGERVPEGYYLLGSLRDIVDG